MASSYLIKGSAISKALLLTSVLAFSSASGNQPTTIMASGGRIDVFVSNQTVALTHEDLMAWVGAAAKSVSTYYGRFPVDHVEVRIITTEGRGVRNGRTFGSPVPLIRISIGRDTTPAELKDDWTMTHEMVHLAFPSVSEKHHWIEEGIATYVEPIARVQSGTLDPGKMWGDVIRDLPQGLPGPGDRGLDVSHTWGRTYWGGALFCFLADLEIRQKTHNQTGLEDALRGILAAGGNITQDWPLERALRVGDEATRTTVLQDLYQKMGEAPMMVDLNRKWQDLGVRRSQNGDVSFSEDAPLAALRKAITMAPSLR